MVALWETKAIFIFTPFGFNDDDMFTLRNIIKFWEETTRCLSKIAFKSTQRFDPYSLSHKSSLHFGNFGLLFEQEIHETKTDLSIIGLKRTIPFDFDADLLTV